MANSVIDRVLEFLEVEEIKAYKLEDDGLGVCMELEDISVEMMLYYDENQRMVTIDSIDFLEIPQSKYDDIYKLINEFNFKDMFNKYVLDTEDGQMCVSTRIDIRDDDCVRQCYVALRYMAECLQEVHPKFIEVLEA